MQKCVWVCAVLMAGVTLCFAQVKVDQPGSSDHPLISRYPGSFISSYKVIEFDEFTLPLGKSEGGKLAQSQKLEGKITNIVYDAPAGRSILEVYRNYESALTKGGFKTLFSCEGIQACGGRGPVLLAANGSEDWNWNAGMRILSAKLTRGQGDVYAHLLVGQWSDLKKGSWVNLYIVETKPMETGLITVNAAALAGDIGRTGHSAVYGIYFDTGKAEIKAESEPALKEIAKLLSDNSALKLLVVGHTDNVGALAANMDLSKRRAAAVVEALVGKYGVPASRLNAQGAGPLAPVSSNSTDEGRAQNRRVELVEQ